MKSRRLKYIMVGGGPKSFIGPIHRMAVRMDDLADLVGGCYSHTEDWRPFLESMVGKADFVSVCTPNDSHYAIAKRAMELGFDVLCEKPLSMTLAEAEDLTKIARRKRRVLAIPFTYTGFPMVKAARELVANGELGKISKVVIEYQQGSFREIDFTKPLDVRSAWKMNPKRSGPSCVVADIGVHAFELIEYVTGLEVKTLLADLSSFAPGNRLDDDASVLLRLSGGAKAALTCSKIATGEENGVRFKVYGEKAALYWNQEAPNYLNVRYPHAPERIYKRRAPYMGEVSPAANAVSRIPSGHHEGFIEAFANIYAAFCEAVRTRKPGDFPSLREGVRSMRFVEATLESNRRGNVWVKM